MDRLGDSVSLNASAQNPGPGEDFSLKLLKTKLVPRHLMTYSVTDHSAMHNIAFKREIILVSRIEPA